MNPQIPPDTPNNNQLFDECGKLAYHTIDRIMKEHGTDRGMMIITTTIGSMIGSSYGVTRNVSGRKPAIDFLSDVMQSIVASAFIQGHNIEIKIVEKD